jgi:choline-sulfatase
MTDKHRNLRKYVIIVLLVVVIAGLAWLRSHATTPASDVPLVILISIDTCRADHLSCYGYEQPTTPNIDALAAESVLFENVISPMPQTLPAHASMLTGTIPPTHGVHFNKGYRFGEVNVALPEILKDAGYTTDAIVSAFVLDSHFGMAQGFDTYLDRFASPLDGETVLQRQGEETTDLALKWLDRRSAGKSFLFLHYYDPHMLYRAPEPFATCFAEHPYAGEIAYVDYCIGQLLDRLKAKGLYDSSLIIVTSDHGEMLGEHGEDGHGYFIYQPAIRVPLIVKLPGRTEARRISELVGIIDIVPTVCGLLDIPAPVQVQGIDLAAAFDGRDIPADRSMFCESLWPTQYRANSLLGLVDAQFKYIQTTRPELYDLVADPGETDDLSTQQPDRARQMQETLAGILRQSVNNKLSDGAAMMDAESRRRLESLGYVGGPVAETLDFDQSKPDPKDFIAYFALAEKGIHAFELKDYDKAEQYANQQIELRPELPYAYTALAKIATVSNQMDKAIELYSKVIEIEPVHIISYDARGSIYARQGRHQLAIRDFDMAIELVPIDPGFHNKRGYAYMSVDDLGRAMRDFDRAIELNPEYGLAYNNRGLAYIELGQYDRAVSDFDRAVQLNPRHAKAWNNRGLAWFRKGNRDKGATDDYTRALRDFTQAIVLHPGYSAAYFNRGSLHAVTGNHDQAARDFQSVIGLMPNNPAAHGELGKSLIPLGRAKEAIDHYRRALELRADWVPVMTDLAWRLSTTADDALRDGAEAVRLAERAAELVDNKNPIVLDTLAAAYAEAGDFPAAVETAERVLAMATAAGEAAVAADIRKRLMLYQAGRAYRVP